MKMNDRKTFRLSLPTIDVDAFLGACTEAEWKATDTGERLMTDEGPDAEAVLLVAPAGRTVIRPAGAIARS